MKKNSYSGKFIVFEGIDGSGKSTQLKLLSQYFKKQGYKIATFDFPQYGKKSAGLVEEYLAGRYGSLKEVGPYEASIFYAVDRYDASFKIKDWLKKGFLVLSDRYVGSNIGHQGGKIKDKKKRAAYFTWLYNLEYNIFKIPKPTLSVILNMPPRIAYELCQNSGRRKTKKSDIHEENLTHLENAKNAYLHAASLFPKDFRIVESMVGKTLCSPSDIHKEVLFKIHQL